LVLRKSIEARRSTPDGLIEAAIDVDHSVDTGHIDVNAVRSPIVDGSRVLKESNRDEGC
jgi:hypothetical protein